MNVSKYMTRKVITARPDEGVRTVFFRMRQNQVRHMPVVNGSGQLVGWLSDRDLRRPDWADPEVDLAHDYELGDNLTVGDMMNGNPHVVHTFDSVHKVANLLLERRYGALPVLDKQGDLVGVLSAVDLVRALTDLLDAAHKKGR